MPTNEIKLSAVIGGVAVALFVYFAMNFSPNFALLNVLFWLVAVGFAVMAVMKFSGGFVGADTYGGTSVIPSVNRARNDVDDVNAGIDNLEKEINKSPVVPSTPVNILPNSKIITPNVTKTVTAPGSTTVIPPTTPAPSINIAAQKKVLLNNINRRLNSIKLLISSCTRLRTDFETLVRAFPGLQSSYVVLADKFSDLKKDIQAYKSEPENEIKFKNLLSSCVKYDQLGFFLKNSGFDAKVAYLNVELKFIVDFIDFLNKTSANLNGLKSLVENDDPSVSSDSLKKLDADIQQRVVRDGKDFFAVSKTAIQDLKVFLNDNLNHHSVVEKDYNDLKANFDFLVKSDKALYDSYLKKLDADKLALVKQVGLFISELQGNKAFCDDLLKKHIKLRDYSDFNKFVGLKDRIDVFIADAKRKVVDPKLKLRLDKFISDFSKLRFLVDEKVNLIYTEFKKVRLSQDLLNVLINDINSGINDLNYKKRDYGKADVGKVKTNQAEFETLKKSLSEKVRLGIDSVLRDKQFDLISSKLALYSKTFDVFNKDFLYLSKDYSESFVMDEKNRKALEHTVELEKKAEESAKSNIEQKKSDLAKSSLYNVRMLIRDKTNYVISKGDSLNVFKKNFEAEQTRFLSLKEDARKHKLNLEPVFKLLTADINSVNSLIYFMMNCYKILDEMKDSSDRIEKSIFDKKMLDEDYVFLDDCANKIKKLVVEVDDKFKIVAKFETDLKRLSDSFVLFSNKLSSLEKKALSDKELAEKSKLISSAQGSVAICSQTLNKSIKSKWNEVLLFEKSGDLDSRVFALKDFNSEFVKFTPILMKLKTSLESLKYLDPSETVFNNNLLAKVNGLINMFNRISKPLDDCLNVVAVAGKSDSGLGIFNQNWKAFVSVLKGVDLSVDWPSLSVWMNKYVKKS